MGPETLAKGIRTCALLVLTTVARRITAICARLRTRSEGKPAQLIDRRKWRAGQQRLGAADGNDQGHVEIAAWAWRTGTVTA